MIEETIFFGKTFDEIFDKSFKTFTRGIEDHNFRHYNNSLGMEIYSKEQLKHEMKKRKILPYDVCQELAEEWERKNQNKEFDDLSPRASDIIKQMKLIADKEGNIKLGDRAINALLGIGAISTSQYIPKKFEESGGFQE